MTKFASEYEGNFIGAVDLLNKSVKVKIGKYIPKDTIKDSTGKLINKPVLEFEKDGKPLKKKLVCNVTNMKRILMFYAPDCVDTLEALTGVEIELYTELDRNPKMGMKTPCVRVKIPEGARR
jgi:hypothetical protein